MLLAANTKAGGATSLTWGQAIAMLIIVAVLILGVGVVVIVARTQSKNPRPSEGVVRSWIAVVLVSSLVVLGVISLGLADTNTRSVLIGGIAASAGAAVAFYFSSQSSDKAREDILTATFGRETVPDLVTKTLAEATKIIAKSALTLKVAGPAQPGDAMVIVKQQPAAGAVVIKGSAVTVELTPPSPPTPSS